MAFVFSLLVRQASNDCIKYNPNTVHVERFLLIMVIIITIIIMLIILMIIIIITSIIIVVVVIVRFVCGIPRFRSTVTKSV